MSWSWWLWLILLHFIDLMSGKSKHHNYMLPFNSMGSLFDLRWQSVYLVSLCFFKLSIKYTPRHTAKNISGLLEVWTTEYAQYNGERCAMPIWRQISIRFVWTDMFQWRELRLRFPLIDHDVPVNVVAWQRHNTVPQTGTLRSTTVP